MIDESTSSQPAKDPEPQSRRSTRFPSSTAPETRCTTPVQTLPDLALSDRSSLTPVPSSEDASSELSEPPDIVHSPKYESVGEETNDGIHIESTFAIESKPPSRRSSRRARSQPDFTSIESSFTTTSSIAVLERSTSSSPSATHSTTTTTFASSTTSITSVSSSDTHQIEHRQSLQRQESSTLTKSENDGTSATQSSQSSRTLPNLKGRDLFDSVIWKDPFTTSIFYMFISSLRKKIRNEVATTTEAHNFIKVLRDGGRLVRNYTQNIDLLEDRLGLCTDLSRGAGNRARFHYRTQQEPRPADIGGDSPHNGGVEVVLLHGSLDQLRCGICAKLSSWDHPDREAATLSGQAPDCPQCEDHSNKRTGRGRRSLAVGRLRPDIVLYGEEHPSADLVGPLITHDLSLGPDVLLIMGTSLKVHGLKVMIKEFAKSIHSRGGKVVFINRTKPPESTWGDVIDYWVEWDCDAWVLDLKERREDIWLPQGTRIEPKRTDSSDDIKPASKSRPRPQALRDDKMNGVFVTFKILDTLGRFPDTEGQTADRFVYYERPAPRLSMPVKTEPVKKPASKARKSLPASFKSASTTASRKKKSLPFKQVDKPIKETAEELQARFMREYREIQEIKYRWPDLKDMPRDPLKPLSNVNFSDYQLLMHNNSNHFPIVGCWPPKTMLITHPPSGALEPLHHSPRKADIASLPPPPPRLKSLYSRPGVTHSYGTRSSRVFSIDDTIVVDDSDAQAQQAWSNNDDTIVVETPDTKIILPFLAAPPCGPLTPSSQSSQRIKRQSSITAILSSSSSQSDEFHDALEVMA